MVSEIPHDLTLKWNQERKAMSEQPEQLPDPELFPFYESAPDLVFGLTLLADGSIGLQGRLPFEIIPETLRGIAELIEKGAMDLQKAVDIEKDLSQPDAAAAIENLRPPRQDLN